VGSSHQKNVEPDRLLGAWKTFFFQKKSAETFFLIPKKYISLYIYRLVLSLEPISGVKRRHFPASLTGKFFVVLRLTFLIFSHMLIGVKFLDFRFAALCYLLILKQILHLFRI
jgi:hypothetical protein